MDPISEVVWPYFVGLCVAIILYAKLSAKKRRANIEAVATGLGFSFSESGRAGTLPRHRNFDLPNKGSGGKVRNEMWTIDKGNEISIFEYHYTEGQGDSRRSRTSLVLSIKSPDLVAPALFLHPKLKVPKLMVGFALEVAPRLNFKRLTSFSENHILEGQDEDAVPAFFHSGLINFFRKNANLYLEAEGDTFILYKASRSQKERDYSQLLKLGNEVLAIVT